MRCVGCEIDSSAQPQYCECCGRRLSLNDMHRKGPSAFGTKSAREPNALQSAKPNTRLSARLNRPRQGRGRTLDRARTPARRGQQ